MTDNEETQLTPAEREFAEATAELSIAAVRDVAEFSRLSNRTRDLLNAIAAEHNADPAPALEAFKSVRCGVDEAEAGRQMSTFHASLDYLFRED